jgi:hypothetical protein
LIRFSELVFTFSPLVQAEMFMDWLLMLLRLLLGLRPENSERQPVAIRPDGTTVPLPPGSANSVRLDRWKDWLTLILPFGCHFPKGQFSDHCLSDTEGLGRQGTRYREQRPSGRWK